MKRTICILVTGFVFISGTVVNSVAANTSPVFSGNQLKVFFATPNAAQHHALVAYYPEQGAHEKKNRERQDRFGVYPDLVAQRSTGAEDLSSLHQQMTTKRGISEPESTVQHFLPTVQRPWCFKG